MSLIAWWPLNGDTYNKGTLGNELNPTVSNMTYVENGKIGKAKHTGTLTLTADQMTKWINNTISIAMWIYIRDDGTWKNGTPFFSQASTMTAPNNRKFSMFCYDGSTDGGAKTSLHCSWQHDDSNSTYYSCVHKNFFTIGQWTHLCIVQNAQNNKIDLYKNGNLITSTIVTGLNTFNITKVNNTPLLTDLDYLQVNDLRIYDHALSKAEIQELSKALVIHYTFDDILAEPTENKSIPAQWGCYTSYWIMNTSNNIYKLTKSNANSQETTVALSNSTIYNQMNVDDIWTVSCYLYKNGQPFKTTSTHIGTYGLGLSVLHSESRDDGYFSSTFKITRKANSYIIHERLFGANNTIPAGTQCEIQYLQFEKKEYATPYTISRRESMLYNEIGLNQHNNIQNINLSYDAVIGKYALNCNNTYINIPIAGDITQGITASCWIKTLTYPTVNQVVFADYNSKLAFGFYGTQNAIISCGSHPVGIISNIKAKWKQNAWNHITIIRTITNQFICYLNNEQLTLSSSTNNWTTLSDCTIGCRNNGTYNTYFNGLIDDFRLYYTQLSPEEIKDLYSCGGRISNLGDALTGSFIEETATTKVNKSHTIETKEIYEQILPDGYQQLEYIQSSGSQYIKTGIYSNDKITEIKAHYYNTTTDNSQILFGMYDGTRYAYFDYREGNSNYRIAWYNNVIQTEIPFTVGERNTSLKVSGRNYIYTLNDKTFSSTSGADPAGNTEMYLFAYNNRGTPGYSARCKMYNFKISVDNILQRDFIPARRISDNVLGLYDIINNQFYINTGSGDFIAGSTFTTGQASMLHNGGLTAREIIEI